MRSIGVFLLALLVFGCGQKNVSYREQVQTILDKKCISCHGLNGPRGKIVLTSFENLMKSRTVSGKKPLVVAGSPTESKLYILCGTTQVQFRMPTQSPQAEPLTADELQTVGRWIMQGAHDN